MGFAVERFEPGAFADVLPQADVRALFNHDANAVLGRNRAGTLRLSEDKIGLRYEIDVPDTQLGRDVYESIRRGDISGSSFAFIPDDERQEKIDGRTVYTVTRVRELLDVGPVVYPAYSATEADARQRALLERFDRDRQQAMHRQSHIDRCRSYAYEKTLDLNL